MQMQKMDLSMLLLVPSLSLVSLCTLLLVGLPVVYMCRPTSKPSTESKCVGTESSSEDSQSSEQDSEDGEQCSEDGEQCSEEGLPTSESSNEEDSDNGNYHDCSSEEEESDGDDQEWQEMIDYFKKKGIQIYCVVGKTSTPVPPEFIRVKDQDSLIEILNKSDKQNDEDQNANEVISHLHVSVNEIERVVEIGKFLKSVDESKHTNFLGQFLNKVYAKFMDPTTEDLDMCAEDIMYLINSKYDSTSTLGVVLSSLFKAADMDYDCFLKVLELRWKRFFGIK
jgi:hypothetical protein